MTAVGPYIDVVNFGDDLGMQTGTADFPRDVQEVFSRAATNGSGDARRSSPTSKSCFTAAGAYGSLLPDLIDAGLEHHQSRADLVPRHGCGGTERRTSADAIVFWGGGCDTQTVLSGGKLPESIRGNVREQDPDYSLPAAGFVFQQVQQHNLRIIPPANVPRDVRIRDLIETHCGKAPVSRGEPASRHRVCGHEHPITSFRAIGAGLLLLLTLSCAHSCHRRETGRRLLCLPPGGTTTTAEHRAKPFATPRNGHADCGCVVVRSGPGGKDKKTVTVRMREGRNTYSPARSFLDPVTEGSPGSRSDV